MVRTMKIIQVRRKESSLRLVRILQILRMTVKNSMLRELRIKATKVIGIGGWVTGIKVFV